MVAAAMLGNGFLIPAAEDLRTLSLGLQETKEWDFSIPQTFLRFWQPLLAGLHSREFTQTLLEKMFRELNRHARESGLHTRYLINWITEILKTNMQARMLGSSLLVSPHLLHLILQSMEPPLPLDTQKKLLCLTSIYTQEADSLPNPGSAADLCRQPIYTVESLQRKAKQSGVTLGLSKRAGRLERSAKEEDLAEEEEEEEEEMETQSLPLLESFHAENTRALAEKRAALLGSAWQVSSEATKWQQFPLGKLPSQTDDPDALRVEECSMMSALDQPVNGDHRFPTGATPWGHTPMAIAMPPGSEARRPVPRALQSASSREEVRGDLQQCGENSGVHPVPFAQQPAFFK
ncbi:ribosomal biogenesis protein LAS1L-like [Sphaerodactylus townsendi]|uniref:ribosomal biogenesis protein LAS1L-like n=1 Tax=Sphaerodactylus townsendi TaxID=933632 RepID=UPI002026B755|nr:ribosomal biogenesis protein LAS1L-like [Sphaerodactylus townsendi]